MYEHWARWLMGWVSHWRVEVRRPGSAPRFLKPVLSQILCGEINLVSDLSVRIAGQTDGSRLGDPVWPKN